MNEVLHDCAMAILRACDSVLMCHSHPAREWIPDVWDFPASGRGMTSTDTHLVATGTQMSAVARRNGRRT
jgi:hypothetical protein